MDKEIDIEVQAQEQRARIKERSARSYLWRAFYKCVWHLNLVLTPCGYEKKALCDLYIELFENN